jgi:hypothetical protein
MLLEPRPTCSGSNEVLDGPVIPHGRMAKMVGAVEFVWRRSENNQLADDGQKFDLFWIFQSPEVESEVRLDNGATKRLRILGKGNQITV